jgi:signal transduction histidine kinase
VFEETAAIPRIYTDDKKLSQILRNFISNALKFTHDGEVRVGATMFGDGEIEFSVTDTGIGIAAEHLPSLFEDFVQLGKGSRFSVVIPLRFKPQAAAVPVA